MTTAGTALLLVDPYNDFLAEDGAVWPLIRDVAERVGTRANLLALVQAARATGVLVVVAPHRRYRPGDVDGWTRVDRTAASLRDRRLFAADTAGGQWFPGLAPRDGDVVATEHWGMDGFAHTDLDLQLGRRDVRHVILAGLTAPGCLEGTGRQAMERGYSVTLVRDATAAFTADHHRAATELTGPLYADDVVTTAEVLQALTP